MKNRNAVSGFFGETGQTASIKGLAITNITIANNGSMLVGGLVGRNMGSIINCYTSGTVNGGDMVGGLVGSTTSLSGYIYSCFSLTVVNGTSRVGGLAGYLGGGRADLRETHLCWSLWRLISSCSRRGAAYRGQGDLSLWGPVKISSRVPTAPYIRITRVVPPALYMDKQVAFFIYVSLCVLLR